ncbi:MAG: FGGY-family carbohydrate kinase [Acidimicrobiales bacterium]
MDADHVLAIDLGTSGPKVALVSVTGEVAASATEPVALHLLAGGGAEQDPLEWWAATTTAARKVLAESGLAPDRVIAIGCTAQWAGTVACDRNGDPLRPAVSWMDSRGNTAIRRQMKGTVSVLGFGVSKIAQLIRLTGGAPSLSGKDPTAHILWIRDNEPEVYAQTYKFLEPVDWLNQRLTGRFCASFDSIVLHWVTDNRNIDDVHYDDGLLRMTGLDREKLPDLGPPARIIGTLQARAADELGLPEGIPVSTGTGDVHSAAVGSGAVADFDPHIYIGTSSWISCHVPFKKTAATTNVASIPSALPGRYLVADEHETAGACLTFLTNMFFSSDELSPQPPPDPKDALRLFDEVARAIPSGANGVLFTPWLNGERTPVDDHTIRGGFHNLSLGSTRRDMVRAVYEGVAYNSRWLLDAVEKFCGRSFESLTFIGGGANSDIWCQIHADVTGRRIRQVEKPVLAGVRGATFIALMALGRLKLDQVNAMVPIQNTFEPDTSTRPEHDLRFEQFVELYKQTKDIHKRLNRF